MDYIWVLFQSLAGFALGKLIYDLIKKFIHRRRYPYRWKCPQCNFEFETNVRETYEISKSSHNHSSTREYKTR